MILKHLLIMISPYDLEPAELKPIASQSIFEIKDVIVQLLLPVFPIPRPKLLFVLFVLNSNASRKLVLIESGST